MAERRVTILAEAGSGKTDEMRNQVRRLRAEGKHAFFLPLESLAFGQIETLLDAWGQAAFAAWRAVDGSSAWFFLDSVDELKLIDRKLDQALLTFANGIPARLGDVHVIISCRPSDWRPGTDMAAFQRRLPIPPPNSVPEPTADLENYFLSNLEPESAGFGLPLDGDELPKEPGMAFRTVALLPMDNRQIGSFVEQLDPPERQDFLTEIDRRDAWDFARRPLDLLELAGNWSRERKLGERRDQHETDIATKLRDDPDRRDGALIDDLKAREGVERLALALMLTRRQLIRAGDATIAAQWAEATLDPADILPEWSSKQRQALLRRALFDPATLGRVRFHHRSIQEYLAACRIRSLRSLGMPIREILRLLFATDSGEGVVVPSRAPVAAWLALWDAPVRRTLIRLEPETLLSMGDPASLDHGVRAELLSSFANAYGTGSRRGVRVPASELRRLASPELAPTVLRLWRAGPANPDLRELLLTTIWQGALGECAGISSSVAVDAGAADHERVVAVRALLACGTVERVAEIAASMIETPADWSDGVLESVACDLCPTYLKVGDLIGLMERTPKQEGVVGGFGWTAKQMVEAMDDPCSMHAVGLRDGLAGLIWRGRDTAKHFRDLNSAQDHLTPALAALCIRQLTECGPNLNADFVRACVIAGRFKDKVHRYRGDPDPLMDAFREHLLSRAEAFRQEIIVMDAATSATDSWHRYYQAEHESVLVRLGQTDRPWLEAMLADNETPDFREVALHGLLALWHERGRPAEDIADMMTACGADAALTSLVVLRTRIPEPDPEIISAELEGARLTAVRAAKRERALQGWLRWRSDLLADPVGRFREPDVGLTVQNLYQWFTRRRGTADEPNHWDDAAISKAFSPEVAALAKTAFRDHWRSLRPLLWSQRPAEQRNGTPYRWLEGYLGITMEARAPG